MSIQVVSNTTASSTAVVRLRASVAVTDLTASSVSYAIPVSTVAYIDLALGVVLDTTGRFKFIPDAVVVVDRPSFVLSRPLADTAAIVDATFVSALKVLADGFAMNDGSEAVDGSVYSFSKGISNVAFTEDAVANSLAKLTQDQFALIDNAAKVLSRPLTDSAGATDDETVAALKGLTETVGLADAVIILLLAIRDFNDVVAAEDVRATAFSPAVKTEDISVADDDTITVQKALTDGFAMNDGSEAVDGSVYSFSKGISNVAFVEDAESLIFTTSRVESVDVADAGLVSAQNYCDVSYFAQDYVGASQSF